MYFKQDGAKNILNLIKNLVRRKNKTKTKKSEPSKQGEATIIPRKDHCISRADISSEALKVLRRLDQQNFEAYLVGGGVRDLLLRQAPKDFDIATNAQPNQVRKLFRNCRLIGRRFRLAHILFGRTIIEVATFRSAKEDKDRHHDEAGMIVRDNVYGTLSEDVWRRDFTVNALYYNIADFSIVDHTNGMADIQNKIIRIIGDAKERFQEDPVRILRAIRFAAKLNFTLHPDTAEPIEAIKHTISSVPTARIFEEVLKLFHGGKALATFKVLQQYNLFATLFPATAKCLSQSNDNTAQRLIEEMLSDTDKRINAGKPVTPAFLFATLLWYPMQDQAKHFQEKEKMRPLAAIEKAMSHVIREQQACSSVPKRLCSVIREIWMLQYRLPRRYGKRPYSMLAHPRFRASYDFLLLRTKAGEVEPELADWWTHFQTADEDTQEEMIKKSQAQKNKKPRKRSST